MGVTAAFSFYPGKNLGALGDGGAVDHELGGRRPHGAAAAQPRRGHQVGARGRRATATACTTCRPASCSRSCRTCTSGTTLEASRHGRYDELLASVRRRHAARRRATTCEHVYHLYVVQVEDRDAVREKLGADGVQTGIHYPVPLHLQPAYAGLGYGPGDFPVAEALAPRILSLPMFPQITPEQQEYVVERLAAAVAGGRRAASTRCGRRAASLVLAASRDVRCSPLRQLPSSARRRLHARSTTTSCSFLHRRLRLGPAARRVVAILVTFVWLGPLQARGLRLAPAAPAHAAQGHARSPSSSPRSSPSPSSRRSSATRGSPSSPPSSSSSCSTRVVRLALLDRLYMADVRARRGGTLVIGALGRQLA